MRLAAEARETSRLREIRLTRVRRADRGTTRFSSRRLRRCTTR